MRIHVHVHVQEYVFTLPPSSPVARCLRFVFGCIAAVALISLAERCAQQGNMLPVRRAITAALAGTVQRSEARFLAALDLALAGLGTIGVRVRTYRSAFSALPARTVLVSGRLHLCYV